MAEVNEEIFRRFDVRGKYPGQFNAEAAYFITRAFLTFSKTKKLLVGRDVRLSSKSIFDAVCSAAASRQVEVSDIGEVSTPAFYFAIIKSNAPAGIMVTASHLDKEFNGLKMVLGGNIALTEDEMLAVKKIALEDSSQYVKTSAKIKQTDFKADYIKAIRLFARNKIRPLKVIVDCGNSVAGFYADEIFKDCGANVEIIFGDIDGNFPNHGSNPKEEKNRQSLKNEIVAKQADLGFIFDGDADRMMVLDSSGELVNPSFIGAILARYLIKKGLGKSVVATISCSKIISDMVQSAGGNFIWSPVWHTNVKARLRRAVSPILGVELSGHFIFPFFNFIDDGILAALIFLQAISAEKKDLKEILADFRSRYFISDEINFEVDSPESAKKMISDLQKKFASPQVKADTRDGLTMDFGDWRFNIRPSLSEPLLRLNLEAKSNNLLKEKIKQIKKILKE